MNTPALPPLPCYLNGEFSTLAEAKVSVMDRGFIFGDGIYEVVPLYGGRPFRFAHHMARLERSLAEIRIPNPMGRDEWLALVDRLAQALASHQALPLEQTEQLFYLQVTRGVALRDHVMPADLAPTVFAMCTPMKPITAAQRAQGVACVSADDFRWRKAHIKSTSLLGAVLSRQISADEGATETVMFRDDCLSEAAASNVWVVQGQTVLGPPRDHLVLEGIRYGLIESLCQAQGLGFELRPISRAEVLAADELLLSSATKEVVAITRLDGQAVGAGVPGPVYQRLYAAYQRAKREDGSA